jgi:hypothetical protein
MEFQTKTFCTINNLSDQLNHTTLRVYVLIIFIGLLCISN